jgi:hypothetical protein
MTASSQQAAAASQAPNVSRADHYVRTWLGPPSPLASFASTDLGSRTPSLLAIACAIILRRRSRRCAGLWTPRLRHGRKTHELVDGQDAPGLRAHVAGVSAALVEFRLEVPAKVPSLAMGNLTPAPSPGLFHGVFRCQFLSQPSDPTDGPDGGPAARGSRQDA